MRFQGKAETAKSKRGRTRSRSKSRDGMVSAGIHNYDLTDSRPLKSKRSKKGTAVDIVRYRGYNGKTMKAVAAERGCSPLRSKS